VQVSSSPGCVEEPKRRQAEEKKERTERQGEVTWERAVRDEVDPTIGTGGGWQGNCLSFLKLVRPRKRGDESEER